MNVTQLTNGIQRHDFPEVEHVDYSATFEAERQYRAFQREVAPGHTVEARWTVNTMTYKALANVVQVNRKSVRVELLEGTRHFEAGQQVTVPLKTSNKSTGWTRERGIFPVEGE